MAMTAEREMTPEDEMTAARVNLLEGGVFCQHLVQKTCGMNDTI